MLNYKNRITQTYILLIDKVLYNNGIRECLSYSFIGTPRLADTLDIKL